jgi:hypothetical protein
LIPSRHDLHQSLSTEIIGVAWGKNSSGAEVAAAAKDILATLLPVIGTWIGTVLAFFYSKENFESAARPQMDSFRSYLNYIRGVLDDPSGS